MVTLLRGAVLPPSASAALAITSPVQYQCQQRSGSTGTLFITGTASAIPAGGIEASFNGGAYATIVANPGGTWSGSLSGQTPGQGTLTVRAVNDTGITASVADVSLGDIYIVAGDSNHSGRATTAGTYLPATGNGLVASLYGNDGTWKVMQENHSAAAGAFDDPASSVYTVNDDSSARGSYFGRLAAKIMDNQSIPVAFVPCALGGSSAGSWAPSTSTSTLYGAALARANAVSNHQAMLLLVGTNDVISGDAAVALYEARLTAIVQDWYSRTGRKVVVCIINTADIDAGRAASVRALQATVIADNPDSCISGPDFDGDWASLHYANATECETAATSMYNALVAAGVYS